MSSATDSPARALRQHHPTRSVTARVSDSSLVPIINFVLSTTVQPNTQVPISLTIGNTASFISPFEPDVCTRSGFNGYMIDVTLFVDGQTVSSEQKCVNAIEDRTWEFTFTSGAAGATHDVVLEVRGAKTGNLLHTIERTVDVSAEAPPAPECETNADCPGDLVCRDGQCIEPTGPAEEFPILLVLGLFALVAIGLAAG